DRIIAKKDSAGAASARTHALTQGAKIVIRVYDIAFERFPGGVVVTTVVQSDPLSAKGVAVGEVGPGPGGCHKRPLSKERLANPSRNQIVERTGYSKIGGICAYYATRRAFLRALRSAQT